MESSRPTKVQLFFQWCQNHRFYSVLIIIVIIISSLAAFLTSVRTIIDAIQYFLRMDQQESYQNNQSGASPLLDSLEIGKNIKNTTSTNQQIVLETVHENPSNTLSLLDSSETGKNIKNISGNVYFFVDVSNFQFALGHPDREIFRLKPVTLKNKGYFEVQKNNGKLILIGFVNTDYLKRLVDLKNKEIVNITLFPTAKENHLRPVGIPFENIKETSDQIKETEGLDLTVDGVNLAVVSH